MIRAEVAEMKTDRNNKTFYGTKYLIECLSPFSCTTRWVFNSDIQLSSMNKRRHSVTSENPPPFQLKRRNGFTEASTLISAPRPFASLVALRSDIVRLSRVSPPPLSIHSSHRSFRGGQGISGRESPPTGRLWHLRWRPYCCICLLLHGR